jgi:hypothetical protein
MIFVLIHEITVPPDLLHLKIQAASGRFFPDYPPASSIHYLNDDAKLS